MLQSENPDDYVVSTGTCHTVREFCEIAFSHVGLNYQDYVVVDERFFRPAEVDILLGDSSKARTSLGWQYDRSFEDLVREMVDSDLKFVSDKCSSDSIIGM